MSLADAIGVLDGSQARAAVSVRRRRLRLLPYVLLAPSLLFLVLFTYLPVARVLVESFYDKPHGTGAAVSFVGLGNYARVLADPAFRQAALNNLVYAVGVLVPTLVLALAFALAVQRSTRFSAVLRTVFFFPSLVPLVAAASLFFFIFLPGIGLLDYYLAKIGLRGPNWLGDSDVALWSVIGLTVWKNAGYYMLFYIAGLQNVPRDTLEAAMIDGANAWQRLRFVILPALAPTTAFVVVIALIQLLTNVDHIIVLTRGGPSNATNLLLYYIFQSAHENFEVGKAAAATLMSVAVLLAISLSGALGAGTENTLLSLTLVFIPPICRVSESVTTQVRGFDFVDAARASGASALTIVRVHVLGNVLGPILVSATSLISVAIILAAGLSFLGLGVKPPEPEWGLMLNTLRQAIYVNPVLAALPGVMIFITSICFNLMSDGLRAAMDVKA